MATICGEPQRIWHLDDLEERLHGDRREQIEEVALALVRQRVIHMPNRNLFQLRLERKA